MLERKTITESAAEAIRDYILRHDLKEGDALPPEQVLSETFGVSRNIIREAMQQFREAGIIVSRPRTGARIRSLKPSDPYRPFLPFLEKNESALKELAQVRTALEIGSVPGILAGKTPEKMAALEEACVRFEQARTPEEKVEAEIAFHTCLLQFPGNSILESLLPLLVRFFDCRTYLKLRDRSRKAAVCAEHRAIVQALKEENETALRKSMMLHAEHYPESAKKTGKNGVKWKNLLSSSTYDCSNQQRTRQVNNERRDPDSFTELGKV